MKYNRKQIIKKMERKIKELDEQNELAFYEINTYIINLGTIEEFNEYKHEINTDKNGDSYLITKGKYNKMSYITDVKIEVDDYLQKIDEYIFVTNTF